MHERVASRTEDAAVISLRDILDGSAGILLGEGTSDLLLRYVRHDSREIGPGDLFVALVGEHRDGHDFVADALARGAGAVMIDRQHASRFEGLSVPVVVVEDTVAGLRRLASYWRSLFAVQVIGVTGSLGKTSTKEAIASVAAQRFRVVRTRRSFNTEIGVSLGLLEITPDTEVVVLELGEAYRLGEVRELCELGRPAIGVVTNVSSSHLSRMGSIEAIAASIAELPESLPEDGVAVLNGDDLRVRAMVERCRCPVILYGLARDCIVRAESVESHGLAGLSFDLLLEGQRSRLRLPLLGRHSVHTALAAIAVGRALGMTLEEILRGFTDPAVQVRLLTVPGINGSTLLDDTYNANPTSCLAALSLLAEIPARRRVAVFGDMYELGWYEDEGHRLVGRRAAAVVDLLFTLGPRARLIAEEAVAAGLPASAVVATEERHELIALLRGTLTKGDFVLVKGARGMRLEEIVEALRTPRRPDEAT
jgi:UDP-N-acetylmuramoyl-tripeptide--D-alanyl-D-alanine ligase